MLCVEIKGEYGGEKKKRKEGKDIKEKERKGSGQVRSRRSIGRGTKEWKTWGDERWGYPL